MVLLGRKRHVISCAASVQIAAVAGVSPDTVDRTARNQAVERPAETLGADGKVRDYTSPRVVSAVEIDDEPTPSRVTLQAFERDIRRLRDGYARYANDPRFAARFGPVMAAINAALEEGI